MISKDKLWAITKIIIVIIYGIILFYNLRSGHWVYGL
jgi:hypothetical protein